MASTYEEIMAKSRELYGAGDIEGAKRLAKIALGRKQTTTAPMAQLSADFQQATTPMAGPPMSDEMKLRHKAKEYYSKNDEGALTAGIGGLAQGGTFGLSDEITAGLQSLSPDVTYDQALAIARGRLEAARDQHPVAAYGGEIAGSVAVPVGAAAQGGTLGVRAGRSAMAGGLGGGLYGFFSGEGGAEKRGKNAVASALLGAGIGGAVPVIGAGIRKLLNSREARAAIAKAIQDAPSTEDLKSAGRAAYSAIDSAGVAVKPETVKSSMDDIASYLASEGAGLDVGGKVFPGARAIMEAAQTATEGKNTIPFNELDVFRRFAGNIAGANPANKADTRLATTAVSKIDDMVRNLTPDQVDSGDLATLQEMLPKARDIWSRMSRSQMIDDAIAAGDNYMSGAASGIRNQFARLLRNPKLSRSFSDTEKTVMKRVVNGTIPERLVHIAGGGLGKLTALAGGTFGGGLGGAAAGVAAATGLEKASEAIVRRNAEIARALIANGGLKAPPQASEAARKIAETLLMRGSRPLTAPFGQTAASMLAQ